MADAGLTQLGLIGLVAFCLRLALDHALAQSIVQVADGGFFAVFEYLDLGEFVGYRSAGARGSRFLKEKWPLAPEYIARAAIKYIAPGLRSCN